MKDELVNSGPVKLKAVDAAQQTIISTARELEKQGTITLKGAAAEQYVQ
jgi:flagellar motor switch protein FliG